jgi:thioredoxin-dependent peroxiredoxin
MLQQLIFGDPLKIGQAAPDFGALDQDGVIHKLTQYRGQWVVLYFYPRDFTPGCTAEACSFRDGFEEIRSQNAVILGVSTDSVEKHQKFAQAHRLPFKMLSDSDKSVSRAFGTLTMVGVSNRVTFLIDPNGVIRDVLSKISYQSYASVVAERLSKLKEQI